jgi:hypothetical protein
MEKSPHCPEEEVQRIFAPLSEGGEVATVKRVWEKRVADGKTLLASHARNMN